MSCISHSCTLFDALGAFVCIHQVIRNLPFDGCICIDKIRAFPHNLLFRVIDRRRSKQNTFHRTLSILHNEPILAYDRDSRTFIIKRTARHQVDESTLNIGRPIAVTGSMMGFTPYLGCFDQVNLVSMIE